MTQKQHLPTFRSVSAGWPYQNKGKAGILRKIQSQALGASLRVSGVERSGREFAGQAARRVLPRPARPQRHAPFGKRLNPAPAGPTLSPEIAFLAHHQVPREILSAAAEKAARHATSPRQELFAGGFDREDYWSLLAENLELAFVNDLTEASLCNPFGVLTTELMRTTTAIMVESGGRRVLVTAPGAEDIALIEGRLSANPRLAERICIASPETIRSFIATRRHTTLTYYALTRLARVLPRLSTQAYWRRHSGPSGHLLLFAALLGAAMLAPLATIKALGLILTLFFFNCSFWKAAAAFCRPRPLKLEPISDRRLPTYSVLVPLYREAAIVPDLIRHLKRLDYPALCISSTMRRESRSAIIPQWQTRTSYLPSRQSALRLSATYAS